MTDECGCFLPDQSCPICRKRASEIYGKEWSMEEKDILDKAKEITGEYDSEGYVSGTLEEIRDTVISLMNEVDTLRGLLLECKEAGTYDAAMHKRDKKQLKLSQKSHEQMKKMYAKLISDYGKLGDKYSKACRKISGVPLEYPPISIPQFTLPAGLILNSIQPVYCSSDCGEADSIRKAEEILGIDEED